MAVLPQKYACLFIDATWNDILAAFSYSMTGTDKRKALQTKVESLFGGSEQWLACFSVRTALDAFLGVMKFPAGSEVIFTAINIPDMVYVVESHGLKVVPVDLDLDTLAPKPELVELAVNDKTVAILAAHLYGKWINLDKVIQVARTHGLYVLEDCAESFQGLKRKGHALSDLSFFSFGSIKHYTSLGGAVVGVKNPGILKKMRAKVEQYTVQSQWTYFKKLTSYSILMAAGFNNSFLNWFSVNSFHLLGLPYKEYMISLLRSFPGGVALSKQNLQQQPSAMLLRFLLHRLKHINDKDFHNIKLKGDFVSKNLPENVFVPGKKADKNSYWLFPLVVDNPEEVVRELEKEGVEAYRGATQLSTVFRTKPREETNKPSTIPTGPKTPGMAYSTFPQTEVAAAVGAPSHASSSSLSFAEYLCSAPVPSGSKGTSNSLSEEKEDILFPHNAKYLIDHVLYLPVHKNVPFWYLEHICTAVEKVMKNRKGVKMKDAKNVLFKSKL